MSTENVDCEQCKYHDRSVMRHEMAEKKIHQLCEDAKDLKKEVADLKEFKYEVRSLQTSISELRETVDSLKNSAKKDFVTNARFAPIEKLFYVLLFLLATGVTGNIMRMAGVFQ